MRASRVNEIKITLGNAFNVTFSHVEVAMNQNITKEPLDLSFKINLLSNKSWK